MGIDRIEPLWAIAALIALSWTLQAGRLRRLRRTGRSQPVHRKLMVIVLMVGVTGAFTSAVVGALVPSSLKLVAPWVCEGRFELTTQRIRYGPASAKTVTNAWCHREAGGEPREISGQVFLASVPLFGGMALTLLLWLTTARRWFATRAPDRPTRAFRAARPQATPVHPRDACVFDSMSQAEIAALPLPDLGQLLLRDLHDHNITDPQHWFRERWLRAGLSRATGSQPLTRDSPGYLALEEAWAWLHRQGLICERISDDAADRRIQLTRHGRAMLAQSSAWAD